MSVSWERFLFFFFLQLDAYLQMRMCVLQLNRVLAQQGFEHGGFDLSTKVDKEKDVKSLASGERRTKLSRADLAELNRQLVEEGFTFDGFDLSTLVSDDIVKSLASSEVREKLSKYDLAMVSFFSSG